MKQIIKTSDVIDWSTEKEKKRNVTIDVKDSAHVVKIGLNEME